MLRAVEDELRPETIEVVKESHAQGIDAGCLLVIIVELLKTYIAKQAGISHVIAEVLPFKIRLQGKRIAKIKVL